MNRKNRLILCIVTAMLLTLLPVTFVSAQQTEKIDLTTLTEDADGPGWTWDYDSKTLLLNNLDMDTSGIGSTAPILKLPAGSTIALADGSENRILSSSTSESGIYSEGDLEIIGSGQLVIEGRGTYALYAEGDIAVVGIESLIITSQSSFYNWNDSIVAEGDIILRNAQSITAVSRDSGMTAEEDLYIENVDHLEIALNEREVSKAVLSGQRITIRNCGNIELSSLGMSGRGLYAFATDGSAFIMIENCEMVNIDATTGILSSGHVSIEQSSVIVQSSGNAIVIAVYFGGDYDSYGGDIEIIRSYARLDSVFGVALLATSDLDRARIILKDSEIIDPENAYIVNAAEADRWTGQSVTDQPDLDEATDPSMLLSNLEIAPIASDEITNGGDITDEDQDNGETDEFENESDTDDTEEPSESEENDDPEEGQDTDTTDATEDEPITDDSDEADDKEPIPETGEMALRSTLSVLLTLLLISVLRFLLYAKQCRNNVI